MGGLREVLSALIDVQMIRGGLDSLRSVWVVLSEVLVA